jgi:hypothetical protein
MGGKIIIAMRGLHIYHTYAICHDFRISINDENIYSKITEAITAVSGVMPVIPCPVHLEEPAHYTPDSARLVAKNPGFLQKIPSC